MRVYFSFLFSQSEKLCWAESDRRVNTDVDLYTYMYVYVNTGKKSKSTNTRIDAHQKKKKEIRLQVKRTKKKKGCSTEKGKENNTYSDCVLERKIARNN